MSGDNVSGDNVSDKNVNSASANQGVPSDMDRGGLDAVLGFHLSDSQWEAVSAPLAPGVIVAGAGTGKTTSMSARVAYLSAIGAVDPDRVLGLTFTNKAASALVAAIRSRVASVGFSEAEPSVFTYNAFAARVVTDYGLRIGHEPKATLLTDGLRYQHAYRMVCSLHGDEVGEGLARMGRRPMDVTDLMLRLDSELSELAIEPHRVVEHDRALIAQLDVLGSGRGIAREIAEKAQDRMMLAALIERWREYKTTHDLWEYIDQVRLAQRIVDQFPDTISDIRSRLDIVLLDEYQDTSIAQRQLLQTLFGEGFPVTAVGDPCQAIYSWRGASVDNIESFPQHFPRTDQRPASRYSLAENRRSGPAVLHVANEISTELRAEHAGADPLIPPSDASPARVDVGLFDTIETEVEFLVTQVSEVHAAVEKRRASAGGTDESIAVLCTTGKNIRRVDRALRARGIPTRVTGAAALLADPAVADTRALLEVVHEPTANTSLVRLLAGARWRVGARDLAVLGERAYALAGGHGRRDTDSIDDDLNDAVAGSDAVDVTALADALSDPGPTEHYSPRAIEAFAEVSDLVTRMRAHTSEPISDFIARAVRELGVDVEAALADPSGTSTSALDDFHALAASVTEIDGRVSLGGFLTWLRDAERFNVTISHTRPRVPGAVELMTVFAAKGLEFTHVFVPFVSEKAFPGGRSRGRWLTSPGVVPWPLRRDVPPHLAVFPDADGESISKQSDKYAEDLRALEERNNERLAYVALTRAEESLTVTGHWWGAGHSTPRGPHRFLKQIRTAVESADPDLCRVVMWAPAPVDGADNPITGSGGVPWPQPVVPSLRAELTQAATAVQAANTTEPIAMTESLSLNESSGGGETAEEQRLRVWHETYEALMEDHRLDQVDEHVVRLGEHVGATTFLRALHDPDAVALDLLRPMPRQPSRAAARGVAWHAWVETMFGQQSLMAVDDLPGAADEDIVSDEQLEKLKKAFANTRYAGREPVGVERGFSVVLGGRVINGRIDAVFAEGDRFEVVDWKTGGTASIDPRQLAIYRLAWAQIAGVSWRDVDAAFVMVATGDEIRPDTDAEVESLLALD